MLLAMNHLQKTTIDRFTLIRRPWAGLAAYFGMLVVGIGSFLLIRHFGEGLTTSSPPTGAVPLGRPLGEVNVVLHVVSTLCAVISLGFVLGRAFRYVGQPPVIGEIMAGLLLGPSVLGAISPAAMAVLIPPAAIDPNGQVAAALKAVSELGIILYMFLVGLELNAARVRLQAHAAIAISHASIIAPFVLGAALALGLYPVFSHSGVPFTSFSLFVGVAMAITAFPVLARILTDRQLHRTELGVVALSCAAADDVTAWCLLAFVVGITRSEVREVVSVAVWALVFITVMFLVVRPWINWLTRKLDESNGPLPPFAVSGTFLLVLLCALATEAIGIHAVFGAFLFGAVVPDQSRIAREFAAKLTDPVTILLLPAFFAYTGMRTQVNLVSGWENWLWCGAIIVVATIGKFGGTVLAGRLSGYGWKDAAALGVLMNTRGLMELIVLNIGLDLGVISPTLFAMMVLMALVTTITTAPVLEWLVPEVPTTGD
jgi:Kef-type K+ transport system membrane component KefB